MSGKSLPELSARWTEIGFRVFRDGELPSGWVSVCGGWFPGSEMYEVGIMEAKVKEIGYKRVNEYAEKVQMELQSTKK